MLEAAQATIPAPAFSLQNLRVSFGKLLDQFMAVLQKGYAHARCQTNLKQFCRRADTQGQRHDLPVAGLQETMHM